MCLQFLFVCNFSSIYYRFLRCLYNVELQRLFVSCIFTKSMCTWIHELSQTDALGNFIYYNKLLDHKLNFPAFNYHILWREYLQQLFRSTLQRCTRNHACTHPMYICTHTPTDTHKCCQQPYFIPGLIYCQILCIVV